MKKMSTQAALGAIAFGISSFLSSTSAVAADQAYSLLQSTSHKSCLSIQQTDGSKRFQASLQPCEPDNKSQLWRFNPRLKQLESYNGLCLHVISMQNLQANQCDYRRNSNLALNGSNLIYRANPTQQVIPASTSQSSLMLATSHPSNSMHNWQFVSIESFIAPLSQLTISPQ